MYTNWPFTAKNKHAYHSYVWVLPKEVFFFLQGPTSACGAPAPIRDVNAALRPPRSDLRGRGKKNHRLPPRNWRGQGGEEGALSHNVSAFQIKKKQQQKKRGSAPGSDGGGELVKLWKAFTLQRSGGQSGRGTSRTSLDPRRGGKTWGRRHGNDQWESAAALCCLEHEREASV